MPFSDFQARSEKLLTSSPLAPLPSKIIPFYVVRHTDVNGNSGRGVVAEGVIFSDGKCVMKWLHQISSMSMFDSVDDLMAIHGHGGKTVMLMWQ